MRKYFVSLNIIITIMSLSFLLNSCSKDDDNDGSVNVINEIKDPYFKEYIQLFVEKGWIKTADNATLTPAEAAQVKELAFGNVNKRQLIASLEGIEYFTGIERLELNYTAVSQVDLSKNTKLTYMKTSGCTAESMTIISPTVTEIYAKWAENQSITIIAPELIEFNCTDSQKLTSLDLTACRKLKIYKCGGCKIKSLDVSNNLDLYLLWCGGTGNITCGQLDVSKNKKLEFLSCDQAASSISKLYVWWEGGRENLPQQLQGEDDRLGRRFIVNTKTQIIKK